MGIGCLERMNGMNTWYGNTTQPWRVHANLAARIPQSLPDSFTSPPAKFSTQIFDGSFCPVATILRMASSLAAGTDLNKE